MVQALINIGEREDRVLTIVKGKFGLKNKSDALNFIISHYEDDYLEPELKPSYIKKLSLIKKKKGVTFSHISELKRYIEKS